MCDLVQPFAGEEDGLHGPQPQPMSVGVEVVVWPVLRQLLELKEQEERASERASRWCGTQAHTHTHTPCHANLIHHSTDPLGEEVLHECKIFTTTITRCQLSQFHQKGQQPHSHHAVCLGFTGRATRKKDSGREAPATHLIHCNPPSLHPVMLHECNGRILNNVVRSPHNVKYLLDWKQ